VYYKLSILKYLLRFIDILYYLNVNAVNTLKNARPYSIYYKYFCALAA